MTVPRADSTMGARVKKLEDELRRIKVAASITQSAVAPSAVAKNSVWYDSSAGNEPKVFDGTAWVPVRDETIATAQQSADTAQATVDPLVPLTDLAAVTTGTTVVGATLASTESGAGVIINDPALPNSITFRTGSVDEVLPASITAQVGGANYGYLELANPFLTAGASDAVIDLEGYDDGHSVISATADNIRVEANAGMILASFAGAVVIGDGTDSLTITGQAVTNADMSSLTNTFPTFPYWYGYLASSPAALASGAVVDITTWTADGTPNSSGITHSAGVFTVPTAGRYRITAQLTYPASNTTGSRVVEVFTGSVGGTILVAGASTGNAANITTAYGSRTVRLAAGATFRVIANQGSGLSLSLVAGVHWSNIQIEWVGP